MNFFLNAKNMKKLIISLLLGIIISACTETKKKHDFYSEGEEVCFTAEPSKRGVVIFVKKSGATYRVSYFDINGKNVEDIFAAYELCDCK
jgi:hypothetical protein